MLLLTDRAADLLREIQAHQEESEKVLRLVNQGDQFELTFDSPQGPRLTLSSQAT